MKQINTIGSKGEFYINGMKIHKLKTSVNKYEEIIQLIDTGLIHSSGEKLQQIFIDTAKATLKAKNKNTPKNWKKKKNI